MGRLPSKIVDEPPRKRIVDMTWLVVSKTIASFCPAHLFCRFPLLENGMVILSNWKLFGVSGSGKLDDVTIPEKPK